MLILPLFCKAPCLLRPFCVKTSGLTKQVLLYYSITRINLRPAKIDLLKQGPEYPSRASTQFQTAWVNVGPGLSDDTLLIVREIIILGHCLSETKLCLVGRHRN